MSSNLIVYLMFVTAFIVLHLAQANKQESNIKQGSLSTAKYCGPVLSSTLGLLCGGVYETMIKKSGPEMELDDYPFAYDYPLRSRSSANAMMGRFGGPKFRRQTRGVWDECCVKPCTINELTSYCKFA